MFIAAFVLIAAHTTVKSVRDSVFLSRFSVVHLTGAMLATAALAGLVIGVVNRLTGGVARGRVILTTYAFVAATLVALGWGLEHHATRWMAWVLYTWSSLFTLFVVAEFWLLANDLFDACAARRVFSIIGAGAILGGIAGGATTRLLVGRIGTSHLLHLVAAELLLAALLCCWARLGREPEAAVEPAAATDGKQADGADAPRRYVRLLTWMFSCMTVAATLIGWQARGIAKAEFASQQDAMTAFFGTLAAVVGVVTFVFQIVGTSRLLRRFGAGACLYALPVVCGIGAAALLATRYAGLAALWPAAVTLALVDAIEFSVNGAASELFFAPLDPGLRDRAKRFIDTVVDRSAGAVAGLLWLLLIWKFHVDQPDRLPLVGFVVLGVVAIWMIAIHKARAGYLDTYRAVIHVEAQPETPARLPPLSDKHRRYVERMLARLDGDATARTRTLRALVRIHKDAPQLGLTWERIEPLVEREVQLISNLQRAQVSEERHYRLRASTLDRLIDEQLNRAIERIARLLALIHPPADVMAIHRSLRGKTTRVRAAALHVLESMVEGPVRARLVDVLEAAALDVPTVAIERKEGLKLLLGADEPRLRACAVWTAAQAGLLDGELRKLALGDPSRRVRAIALWAVTLRRKRLPMPPLSEVLPDVG